MKLMRIFLIWALLLGCTPLVLGQQTKEIDGKEKADSKRDKRWRDNDPDRKNNSSDTDEEKEDEREDDDNDDSGTFEMAEAREPGSRAPDARKRGKEMVAGDMVETKALETRDEIAENYGIRKPKDMDELLNACRKYYRAKELLDAQFTNKESEEYRKKAQVLEREYSRELRQVLPES